MTRYTLARSEIWHVDTIGLQLSNCRCCNWTMRVHCSHCKSDKTLQLKPWIAESCTTNEFGFGQTS